MAGFNQHEEEIKYPEIKKLDPLIRTCHHRLVQLLENHKQNALFGNELKYELEQVLINLANKINTNIDSARVTLQERERLDKVYNLAMALYQDLTQKTRIGNTALTYAYELSRLLKNI